METINDVLPLPANLVNEISKQINFSCIDFMDAENPDYPYSVFWDLPKIRDLAEKYPELIVK